MPHSSFRASFSTQPTLLPRKRLHRLFGGEEEFLQYLMNQARYYGLSADFEE